VKEPVPRLDRGNGSGKGMIQMNDVEKFNMHLSELKAAIRKKDCRLIIVCYDKIAQVNYDFIPPDVWNQYERLIDKGNLLINSIQANEGTGLA